jgi:hypothetical protein
LSAVNAESRGSAGLDRREDMTKLFITRAPPEHVRARSRALRGRDPAPNESCRDLMIAELVVLAVLCVGCGPGAPTRMPSGSAGSACADSGGSGHPAAGSGGQTATGLAGTSGGGGAVGTAGAAGGASGSSPTGGGGNDAPACVQFGGACTRNGTCCRGALCVTDGTASVCTPKCVTSADCDSGCCAVLSGGELGCGPPALCAQPNPCADFDSCLNNFVPSPSSGPPTPCDIPFGDSDAARSCLQQVTCPARDCGQCTRGSLWCTQWNQNQPFCDAFLATMGLNDSDAANNARTELMLVCPP